MVLARGCSDAISRWICLRSPLRSPLTLPFYPSPDFTLLSRILRSRGCRFLRSSYSRFLTSVLVTPREKPPRKITYLRTMSLKHRRCFSRTVRLRVSINSYTPVILRERSSLSESLEESRRKSRPSNFSAFTSYAVIVDAN